MNKQTQTARDAASTLAEDAQALMTATAGVAGDKVEQARKRLAAALENAREFYSRVREKAAHGVKSADEAVRERPYHAIAIAFGVGAIIGYLAVRGRARSRTRNGADY